LFVVTSPITSPDIYFLRSSVNFICSENPFAKKNFEFIEEVKSKRLQRKAGIAPDCCALQRCARNDAT